LLILIYTFLNFILSHIVRTFIKKTYLNIIYLYDLKLKVINTIFNLNNTTYWNNSLSFASAKLIFFKKLFILLCINLFNNFNFILAINFIIYLVIYLIDAEYLLETIDYIWLNLVPIIYNNADKEKAIAIKNNRKKSGVYKWTHKESGKFYIGSSVNLGQRFASYYTYNWILKHSKSSIICKSLLKNGYSEFSLEILEYCNKEDTIKREQFYLDSLNPEYNILKTAGSLLGFKHSEEAKAKIRLALTKRKLSDITKSKQRAARLGFKHSDEVKAKLKEHLTNLNKNILRFAKKKGIKVTILDLETKITTEYDSIRKAAEGIGSAQNVLLRYEKSQLNKEHSKPFKNRYVIVIHRN